MSVYLQVPTRTGLNGAKDKAATIYALASWTAQTNRDFLNKVREVVNGIDSAEAQVDKWFKYCCSRTYTREFGDVFSHPNDTLKHGGDCDDLTILLLAGIMALGIPACPDVVMRDGNGVHVRVRVGFPPHSPPSDISKWKMLDPSADSESRWINTNKPLYKPNSVSKGYGSPNPIGNVAKLSGNNGSESAGFGSFLTIGLVVIAGIYLSKIGATK